MIASPIKIGQKVRFDPFKNVNGLGFSRLPREVIGTVIALYPDHRWFEVEYTIGNIPAKIAFNFVDLTSTGNYRTVYIVKEK